MFYSTPTVQLHNTRHCKPICKLEMKWGGREHTSMMIRNAGSKNPKVLPDPVFATPIISLHAEKADKSSQTGFFLSPPAYGGQRLSQVSSKVGENNQRAPGNSRNGQNHPKGQKVAYRALLSDPPPREGGSQKVACRALFSDPPS